MTDAQTRDAAVVELKKTTQGYLKSNGQPRPTQGAQWTAGLNLLAQIGVVAPPPPPPGDNQPPAKPTLTGPSGITQTGATMSWQAGADNVGVDHYSVYLGPTASALAKVADTNNLSYTFAGLTCGKDYAFGLEVVDASGNKSALGEAIWFPISTLDCAGPPPPPPPPPGTGPPAFNAVGSRGALSDHGGGQLSGTYDHKRFTGSVSFGSADVTCTDCRFDGGIAVTFPGHGKITLNYCSKPGAWYFENTGSAGGHANVFLDHCLVEANASQAIRPKGQGKITATDCWFRSYGQAPTGAHTEAMQILDGGIGAWTRCAFSQPPVSNNTVTGVINSSVNGAGDTYTDCVFGAYDPATSRWSRGGGYYMIYPGQGAFIRPTIYSPAGSAQDAWYNHVLPNTLQSPTYIAG